MCSQGREPGSREALSNRSSMQTTYVTPNILVVIFKKQKEIGGINFNNILPNTSKYYIFI